MRITMIIREMVRSFRRSLWVNLLMTVQMSICFFLVITMMTYYFDVGNSQEYNTVWHIQDREWYKLRMEMDASSTEIAELAFAPDGLYRVSNLYRELSTADDFDIASFRKDQCLYLEESFLDEKFGAGNYDQFIDAQGLPVEYCYNELPDGDGVYHGVAVKSVQISRAAYELFGLRTELGEGLTEENTTFSSSSRPLPLIFGNNYKNAVSVGERFRIYMPTRICENTYFDAYAAGILEKGTMMPTDLGEADGMVNLDTQIIFPTGLDLLEIPDEKQERAKFASTIYTDALEYSSLSPAPGVDYQTAVRAANEISQQYGISLFFTSVGFGAEILLQESQTAVTLLLILTVTMAAFTLFCLISGCLARIQRNLEAYAICLLNGSGLANIVLPGFLECMLLLLPPLAVNFVILRPKMVQTSNFVPFFIILGMAGCVFLLSAGLTVWKIGGINIEELMRRKDG